jgi:hypothetical protein
MGNVTSTGAAGDYPKIEILCFTPPDMLGAPLQNCILWCVTLFTPVYLQTPCGVPVPGSCKARSNFDHIEDLASKVILEKILSNHEPEFSKAHK